VLTAFGDIEFCSHRPIEICIETECGKQSRYVPTRPQNEICAKALYSVGGFLNKEAEAGHALQLRNYLVQYAFYRDIRRVIHAITQAMPTNLEPRGKMRKPRELATTWLSEKDLDKVVDKIFSKSTRYPVRGKVTLSSIHYVTQREDMENGSAIHAPGRKTWAASLPRLCEEIRADLGDHWTYTAEKDDAAAALMCKGIDPDTVIYISTGKAPGDTVDPTEEIDTTGDQRMHYVNYLHEYRKGFMTMHRKATWTGTVLVVE